MNRSRLALAAVVALPIAGKAAWAQTAAPAATPAPAAAPAEPAVWLDGIKFGGQIEVGIAGNPSGPNNNLNYGQLFTDRANEPVMNQALLSVGRPIDPTTQGYDFGFKLQGMYGTDARYTHFAHLFDKTTRSRYQFDIVEASVSLHTPWLTPGGVDFQGGLWPTPLGYETIDPSTNPFYTHSYIFNFGLPLKHAGINAISHLTPNVDVYLGVTAGNQTIPGEDNNGSASILAGLKLTLLDGNLSILGLTHIGPENASRAVSALGLDAGNYNRAYNDIVITYKATDALSFTTELNYVREDLGSVQPSRISNAEAFGVAQYASYALTDTVTLNARAELFVDTRSFFVAAFPQAQGPVNSLEGNSFTAITGTGRNTYGALTIGATYKPPLPGFFGSSTLLLRPELRYDNVVSGNARFNDQKDRDSVTLSADAVLTF